VWVCWDGYIGCRILVAVSCVSTRGKEEEDKRTSPFM
jgi:hypothetical protein